MTRRPLTRALKRTLFAGTLPVALEGASGFAGRTESTSVMRPDPPRWRLLGLTANLRR